MLNKVYFIYDPSVGHVKIGRARSPDHRLAQLRADRKNPNMILLGYVRAPGSYELELHKRFARYRIGTTEYFWYGPLRKHIRTILSLREP